MKSKQEKTIGEVVPITHLEYTRGMLAGLLNFCYRSGFADGGSCPDCELCLPTMTRFHCRCCYVSVLKTAIQAVDEKMEREGIKPPPSEPSSGSL